MNRLIKERNRLRTVAPEFDNLEKALILSIRAADALHKAGKQATVINATPRYIERVNRLEVEAAALSLEIKKVYRNLIALEGIE